MFCLILLPVIAALSVDSYLVETNYGIVRGKPNQAPNGKNVKEFLGIPFAKPPLKNLRFKAPELPEKWEGIRNATEYPNTCIQNAPLTLKASKLFRSYAPNTPESEDCLYLNIWVPDCHDGNCTQPENLPVMMFIFGGAFIFGTVSCDTYDGGVMATEENVIVVTSNYRVGSLGFLSLDSREIRGNAGLFDQQMAMRWVHENIKNFGGNPERVILYGQSAGSACINYHLVAPSSWDYFQGAIMMSGSINEYWSFLPKKRNDELGWRLMERMGCQKKTVNESLECLQLYDGFDIAINQPEVEHGVAVYFPVVDGVLIREHPYSSYSRDAVKECDIMMGVLPDEGTMFLPVVSPADISHFKKVQKPKYKAIRNIINSEANLRETPFLANITELFYTRNMKDKENHDEILRVMANITSDVFFNCPMKRLLEHYLVKAEQKKLKIFTYFYDHLLSSLPKFWMGLAHTFDIPAAFGTSLNTLRNVNDATDEDKAFTKRYLRYWANFARTGDPNISPNGQMEDVKWPEYTRKNEEFLVLSYNTSATGTKYRQEECVFQNKFVPLLMRELFAPYRDWTD